MYHPTPANNAIREWTWQTLDGTISNIDRDQLQAQLIICDTARQEFCRAVQLHMDLLSIFQDAPPHLQRALESARSLVEQIGSSSGKPSAAP